MSDNENVEEQRQEKMAKLYKDLLINVGTTALGIFWFFIGMLIYAIGNFGGAALPGFICIVLPFFIVAVPLVIKFFQVKSVVGLFQMSEYEVITTYGDGRRTSDGGAQSAMINFVLKLLLLGILFALALIIQPIRNIIMIIKYAVISRTVSEKPPFIRSALFFVTLLAGSFIGGLAILIIVGLIRNAIA